MEGSLVWLKQFAKVVDSVAFNRCAWIPNLKTFGIEVAGLLLAAYGYQHGYFNFNWLEQTLLWWQQHF